MFLMNPVKQTLVLMDMKHDPIIDLKRELVKSQFYLMFKEI